MFTDLQAILKDFKRELDKISSLCVEHESRYINSQKMDQETLKAVSRIDQTIEKLLSNHQNAVLNQLSLSDTIRNWAISQKVENHRSYTLTSVFKISGISKLNSLKLNLFKSTLSLSISAYCQIQKTSQFLESAVSIILEFSIDHNINVIQSLSDDFLIVNNDKESETSLIEAGKKCPRLAVLLTSIVFNPNFTDLKYKKSDEVLKSWLRVVLNWIGEGSSNNSWIFSVFIWKVNKSANLTQTSVSLVPIYEILRFIVVFETKLSQTDEIPLNEGNKSESHDETSKNIAKLNYYLLTCIRGTSQALKKTPGSSNANSINPNSINPIFQPYLPILSHIQYEKILDEMVKNLDENTDCRDSMNRLAQITAVSLAQHGNTVMPESVRASAKKLPMQNTTLLEIVAKNE